MPKIPTYIFDIDNTLSDCRHRLHFIQPSPGMIHFPKEDIDWTPDWDGFYAACGEDTPIWSVMTLLDFLVDGGAYIIFVTGRPEKCRDKTLAWLKHYIPSVDNADLFMRADGDHRPDYKVKEEIFKTCLDPNCEVYGVFEDRDQCVNMWRGLGLQCYQVNKGDY